MRGVTLSHKRLTGRSREKELDYIYVVQGMRHIYMPHGLKIRHTCVAKRLNNKSFRGATKSDKPKLEEDGGTHMCHQTAQVLVNLLGASNFTSDKNRVKGGD